MKGHGPSTFSMNTPTTLSVLVPAYNEQHLVYASLERLKILAESQLLERIEVIVVDDGSTDQTPSVLREFERSISAEPNAKMKWVFLRHEVNQGKAAAIRTALQRATAELLFEKVILFPRGRPGRHTLPTQGDSSKTCVLKLKILKMPFPGFAGASTSGHFTGKLVRTERSRSAADASREVNGAVIAKRFR
jgi:hypothetical protein